MYVTSTDSYWTRDNLNSDEDIVVQSRKSTGCDAIQFGEPFLLKLLITW
jgi:hypothetical protein